MSGVLHPVGPEPARTYWLRRGLLLAVVLLLAVLVVVAVAGLTKAAVATSPPPLIAAPAGSPSASLPSSPAASVAPSAASSSPASPSPANSLPADSSAAAPSGAAAPTAAQTGRAAPSATARPSLSTTPATKPRPTTTVVGTPDCEPGAVKVALKGDKTPGIGKRTTFTVSLTNAGEHPCLTSVTANNFELKVYSGKDRIWSSRDCGSSLAAFDKKLAPRADVAWKMTWNGFRSAKGEKCRRGAGIPRAGTYWATAQLAGAKPVQLRMVLS